MEIQSLLRTASTSTPASFLPPHRSLVLLLLLTTPVELYSLIPQRNTLDPLRLRTSHDLDVLPQQWPHEDAMSAVSRQDVLRGGVSVENVMDEFVQKSWEGSCCRVEYHVRFLNFESGVEDGGAIDMVLERR